MIGCASWAPPGSAPSCLCSVSAPPPPPLKMCSRRLEVRKRLALGKQGISGTACQSCSGGIQVNLLISVLIHPPKQLRGNTAVFILWLLQWDYAVTDQSDHQETDTQKHKLAPDESAIHDDALMIYTTIYIIYTAFVLFFALTLMEFAEMLCLWSAVFTLCCYPSV